MYVLRAAGAGFEREGHIIVPPLSLAVAAGSRREFCFSSEALATNTARMLAGIVKPTQGGIFIGDYNTRLQPVQAKRLVGFVPSGRAPLARDAFREIVAARATLWGVEPKLAAVRVRDTLAMLESDDGDAQALALALIRPVELVVLDRPSRIFAMRASDIVLHDAAIVSLVVETAVRVPVVAEPAFALR
jgi:ABC-type Na+ transport system ATPase subunit NatA